VLGYVLGNYQGGTLSYENFIPIGIDASWSSTGVAIERYPGAICTRAVTTKPEDFDNEYHRLLHIVDTIIGDLPSPPNSLLVVVEGYSFGNSQRAHKMGELGGHLRIRLLDFGVALFICPPSVLKVFATGKGKATNTEVALGAYKKWGAEFETDDECDAYVLMQLARAIRDGKDTKEFKKLLSNMEKL
jgi:crossover junction endodeoxyribonuclease RuvC